MITHKPINVSDERLAEMAKVRDENAKILDSISKQRQALNQEKAKFDTYRQVEEDKIKNQKILIKREADNLEANRTAFEDRVKAYDQDHMHEVK